MSKQLNVVLIQGVLNSDPIINTMKDGNIVAVFALKQAPNVEKQNIFRVVVYQKDCIDLLRRAKKDMHVFVQGNLNNREYINKLGEKESIIEIVVNQSFGDILVPEIAI